MFGTLSIYDYDLTQKQNHDYHKLKDVKEKCKVEKIKKNPGRLIDIKALGIHNIFEKE
jgi:hypothetical protein